MKYIFKRSLLFMKRTEFAARNAIASLTEEQEVIHINLKSLNKKNIYIRRANISMLSGLVLFGRQCLLEVIEKPEYLGFNWLHR